MAPSLSCSEGLTKKHHLQERVRHISVVMVLNYTNTAVDLIRFFSAVSDFLPDLSCLYNIDRDRCVTAEEWEKWYRKDPEDWLRGIACCCYLIQNEQNFLRIRQIMAEISAMPGAPDYCLWLAGSHASDTLIKGASKSHPLKNKESDRKQRFMGVEPFDVQPFKP